MGVLAAGNVSCADQLENGSRDTAAYRNFLAITNTCSIREEGSRWIGQGMQYSAVAQYGLLAGEELSDVWGIDTNPEGKIFVFNAGMQSVVKLDKDLAFVSQFGGRGLGPG